MKRICFCLIMLVTVTFLFVSSSNAQISKRQPVNVKKLRTKPTLFTTKIALENSLNKLQESYKIFLKNPNNKKTRGILNNALNDATTQAERLAKLSKEQEQQLGRTPQRPSTGGPVPSSNKQTGRWDASKGSLAPLKGKVPIRQEGGSVPGAGTGGPSPSPEPNDPPPKPDPPDPTPHPQGPQGGISKGDMTRLFNMTNSLLEDFSKVRSISTMQTKMSSRSMNILSTKMNSIKGKAQNLALLEPKAEP